MGFRLACRSVQAVFSGKWALVNGEVCSLNRMVRKPLRGGAALTALTHLLVMESQCVGLQGLVTRNDMGGRVVESIFLMFKRLRCSRSVLQSFTQKV